jgi:hypothetical protein
MVQIRNVYTMPGCHKTVYCPHCGKLQRSNNLKRHILTNHQEVAQQVAQVPQQVAQEVAQQVAQVAHPLDYLCEKHSNGEPKWIEMNLPDGNIVFVPNR